MENETAQKTEIGVLYGFRVLMVLAVAVYHFYQQSWLSHLVTLGELTVNLTPFVYSGFLFVDGLMVLTGFLLFLPHAREMTEGVSAPHAGEFYFRRIRRILPSYLTAVLISFAAAVSTGAYADGREAWKDLLAHVLFLQTFTPQTYLFSPLNGALWTIAVEMLFYLLFPLLARRAKKQPAVTLLLMTAAGWAWRIWASGQSDTAVLVNQFPAYLDVYALGMLGAMIYCRRKAGAGGSSAAGVWLSLIGCLFLGWAAVRLVVNQSAHATSYEAVRLYQMHTRFPFSAVLMCLMLCAAFAPRWFRFLLDNRLMRFLSGISMNFYIWHQFLAVELRKAYFPDAEALHGDLSRQKLYTLACFLLAFAAAMVFTYGVEKPAAALMDKIRQRIHRKEKNHEG